MAIFAKNIMIGIFIVIAFAIIVFILLFLNPSVGDNAKTMQVRFTDIDKINIGTRVTYAGLPVGEVTAIQEIPNVPTGRIEYQGHMYIYELTLKLDSGVEVYNTDLITSRTSGLLGEKSIAIIPQPPSKDHVVFLVEKEIAYAEPAPTVEETLKQFGEIGKKVDKMIDGINDTIAEIKDEKIVAKVSHSLQNISDITDSLNQPDKWKKTLDNIWTLSERANNSWTTVDTSLNNIHRLTERAQNSWTALDKTLDNSQTITQKVKEIVNHTSQGKGTIGRLFVTDEIYLRLKSLFSKGETIMNDINQFGILYHLNKKWQRLYAKRLNLLEKLSDPVQFNTHFNDELDQISYSLSNVSMLLNESQYYPSLSLDPQYTERFSDLIKKVEGLDESLKMYNQQVVDQTDQPRSP